MDVEVKNMHKDVSSLAWAEIESIVKFFERRGDKTEMEGTVLRIESMNVI